MTETTTNQKKSPFVPLNKPVFQIDFTRLDHLRLKKGISLRMIKTCLADKYNVYTSRKFINDFFSSRRCPSTCKASFFIAIADIFDVNMRDYIVKANHTQTETIIHNKRNITKSPLEDINKPTKRNVKNNIVYNGNNVVSDFVEERCVF